MTDGRGGGGPFPVAAAGPDAPTAERLVQLEVRHRFRNMVAVAQSLVTHTLRDDASVPQARDTLNRRLAAMGSAVDLLLRNDWGPGSLRDTLLAALAVQAGDRDRVRCRGPEVRIGGDAALALTMAMHELGTNAAKYGALSAPGGSVELSWAIRDAPSGPSLEVAWRERGGPPVRPPSRQGFGTRLLSVATERALGGKVELAYGAGGVTWVLQAPLSRLG